MAMRQSIQKAEEVSFDYISAPGGEVICSIECTVAWTDAGDLEIRFFNPQSGYQNSNPESVRQGWYYKNHEDNYNLDSLIHAVQEWEDWTEHLRWEDGTTQTFEFVWDGEYTGMQDEEGNFEYKELERVV